MEGNYTLKEIHPELSLREHENSVDVIMFDPSNKDSFMTGSHDETVKIWDLNKGKSKTTFNKIE